MDDFSKIFEPLWHKQLWSDGHKHRQRKAQLCLREVMTIQIAFHQSHYRNLKAFYLEKVCVDWLPAFPELVSYNRFVEWIPSALIPLSVYLHSCADSKMKCNTLIKTARAQCGYHQYSPLYDSFAEGLTAIEV